MTDTVTIIRENLEDEHSDTRAEHAKLLKKVKDAKKAKAFSNEFEGHHKLFTKHYEGGNDSQAGHALDAMDDVNDDIRDHLKGLREECELIRENLEDDHSDAHSDHEELIAKVKDAKKAKEFAKEFGRHSKLFAKHYEGGNDSQAGHALDAMDDVNDDIRDHLKGLKESAAADTLHPGGAPGESKAVMLDTFVQLLSQLGKEDLTGLFNQVQAQYGPNADLGVTDNSAANRASISAKVVKEDIDGLFDGGELSEELRDKTAVIFEAAVGTRVSLEMARLAEEYSELEATLKEEQEVLIAEQVEEIKVQLEEKLDQYLDHSVEQWMEDNKLAIETGLRTDIAENFIQGLHNLFSEHYITVPDDKIDLVAEMKAELEEVRGQLNEALDEKLELEASLTESAKDQVIAEAAKGLVATQAEKLRTLAEGVEFGDFDTFARKVSIIKEHHFGVRKPATGTGMIVESIAGEEAEQEGVTKLDPEINAYVNAISKSKK